MTTYLSLGDVIALHNDMMARLGCPPSPLRSEGRLESAVMRPPMAASYEEADLVRQAALLAVGISQARAFLDGNKRTAYQATDVFLWINGFEFVGDPLELAQLLEGVAARSDDLAQATNELESWLRINVIPRS